MADQQIEDLAELTSGNLAAGDLFVLADVSDTTDDAGGTTKKVSASTIKTYVVPEGTAILSTGEAGGTKYLRENGDGTCSWQTVSAGVVTALNNQAANRLVTIGATTTELDGEANLTFTGGAGAILNVVGERIQIQNTDTSFAPYIACGVPVGGTTYGLWQHFGSTYAEVGLLVRNRTALRALDSGGLLLNAENAAGVIVFGTGGIGNERGRISATGLFGINQSSPAAQLDVLAALTTTTGLLVTSATDPSADVVVIDHAGSGGAGNILTLQKNSVDKVVVANTGDLLLGTTNAPTSGGGKVLVFGDNAGDPTPGTNTAGIYGKDVAGTVEMFAIDEAANATQLSSHDKNGDWIFRSENQRTGKRLRIRMEELCKRLARKWPKEFAELIEEG